MGIGKEGQFAPIKISWDGSWDVSFRFLGFSLFVEEVVEPSMAAVEIAARREKIKPPTVARMEVGSTV